VPYFIYKLAIKLAKIYIRKLDEIYKAVFFFFGWEYSCQMVKKNPGEV